MPAFALSPETWPFELKWLPDSACLVGGSVRDALLERNSDYLDLDFVMPEGAVETARAIARHYRAGFVLLDAERQIARVVFPQGTADFAQQVGDSLNADLLRRDFRANAIAYNPHSTELIDPLNGCQDLQMGILSMISPENLAEDPLRLLRAYRQAAQLGFSLDPDTRSVIRQLADRLGQIAAERVQSELNYLLSTAKGTIWLKSAWEDGLVQNWLPNVTANGLARLSQIDRWISDLKTDWPHLATLLSQDIRTVNKPQSQSPRKAALETPASGSTRTWITTAKLACLMPEEIAAAENQLWQLKYSRAEVQAATTTLRHLPQLLHGEMQSSAQKYHFFQAVGHIFPALVINALAAGQALSTLRPLIHCFLDPEDQIAHPTPLLSGQDLMRGLKISPSPKVGKLLAALQLARAEAKITTRDEAFDFARSLLQAE
ncbi:CCA tRNA nucleotidyltransferase [filamentous cyanobacterium LEGE 11480]|uniref:CCA tRNA nucleotidyltransferase n=1 Tax=Romeriopsis navalis LEGE 11480 TaxID=2777977 RepID=A0A928Z194_9CYAN|nr:CCA tRNA nucleotidyltransferase [Romeriopsis navalis]MBE9028279.1 CCA tRNA nucleotidyltransferase [Romeriopsis navalis LEGE 11480]